MTPAPRLTIQASGIEAVHRGLSTRSHIDQGLWEEASTNAWDRLIPVLTDVIQRSGLAGRRVEVVYDNADAVVEMLTLPLPFPEARAAGALRIRESLGGGDACVAISRVPNPSDREASTLFMTADRKAAVEGVAAAVRAAGAEPELIVPCRAAAMRSAIAGALHPAQPGASTYIWMDAHTTAVAGGADGVCRFARSLSLGCDLLVEAFRRAAREVGGCDHAHAWEMLYAVGVPRRGQMVDESILLKGDRVIPLLQPALQRLAIEVKQTIRFGLSERDAARVNVFLGGPGSAVPGLSATLAALTETSVEHASPNPQIARAEAVLSVGFTPESVTARRARRGLLAAAAVGALAAAAAVGLDAAWTTREVRQVRDAVARNTDAVRTAETQTEILGRLEKAQSRADRLDAIVAATVGDQASWTAALKFVSTLSFPGLTLQDILGGPGPDGPALTLRGLVRDAEAAGRPIGDLQDALAASPIAARVLVGATRAVETPDGPATEFSITIILKTLSRTGLRAAAAHAEETR